MTQEKNESTAHEANADEVKRTYDGEESFPSGLSQRAYAKKASRNVRQGGLLVGWTRFVAIGPVIGLLVGAIVLTVLALVTTGQVVIETVQGLLDTKDLLIEFVELADIFLLAVVLYVMSLGLYSLFISDDLPLPHWLEFHTLNDLKEKLIAIVGVALAVYYFGRVVGGDAPINVLYEGVGIAAVIIALAYFMKNVLKK